MAWMMAEGLGGGCWWNVTDREKQCTRIKAHHIAALSAQNPTRISKNLDNAGIKLLVCIKKVPVSNRVHFPEIFPVFSATAEFDYHFQIFLYVLFLITHL